MRTPAASLPDEGSSPLSSDPNNDTDLEIKFISINIAQMELHPVNLNPYEK